TKGIMEGFVQCDDPEFLTWSDEPEVWMNGYWFWDWANQRHKVASIDSETKMIRLEPPFHSYGYRVGQWFYAYNMLSELDAPGEFYIDRNKGILYFIPPDGEQDAPLLLTMIPTIIRLVDASNIMIAGFVFDGCRQTAIDIQNGQDDLVADCEIRNVGGSGITASGLRHWIFGNDLSKLGRGGISITAGDRKTLTSGESAVVNNRIRDYGRVQRMYAAGIGCYGVGNFIANNEITDAPHCAILFGGNEHLFEGNEIARVCQESNDAGAIYAGRDWTMRGNMVRNNHLYDITGFENRGCIGVYLDDMFASCDIVGNLFENVTRAAFIGGGRDNSIVGNIFIDCKPALHIDARALGWCRDHADGWLKEAAEKGTISGIKWNEPPFSTRYPKLARILEGEPKAPEGNVVVRNIAVGGTWDVNKHGQWQGHSVEEKARPYLVFENNLVDEDPLFFDAAKKDYRLKPESPALKNGFTSLPFDKMGRRTGPLVRGR
ncbi:MAG: right-handed parallel beta-helix repeat-containing protein, partial [Thermoguttaceae bacterium]